MGSGRTRCVPGSDRAVGGRDDDPVTSRLFVAVWPDDTARGPLAEAVDSARLVAPEVRWQAPERWHITLAFLGPADPARAYAQIAAVLARSDVGPPQPVRLSGAGTFGPVLWVGVEHGAWLARLAGQLQSALHVHDQRFRAHVTVGRVRGNDGSALARAAVPLLADHHGPAWIPSRITMVESRTGPHPEYRILEEWPLVLPTH